MRVAVVAAAFTYAFDDDGLLWMRMFDANGMLICVAMIRPPVAINLAEYIDEFLSNEDDDDEIGDVAGHA